jgi:[protein-PII] uridylyltransferase
VSTVPAEPSAGDGLRAQALALAEELGATAAEVAAHLDRMPAAYSSSVSPRAVVRHTLMTRTVPLEREVRTRVTPGPLDADGVDPDPALDELDIVALDAPGWFARVAGVIALQGGSIVDAEAHTRSDGVLVDTFTVRPPAGAGSAWWVRVEGDLVDAAAGRLALRARVAQRAQDDGPARPGTTSIGLRIVERPDGAAVARIEVRTEDRVGVLHGVAGAMAELELDIVDAAIHTVGEQAHDVFHVRVRDGSVPDADHLAELEHAIVWALGSLGAPTAA